MKKIILFATIVMLAISASAQVKYSRTYDKVEKKVEKKAVVKAEKKVEKKVEPKEEKEVDWSKPYVPPTFNDISWILRGGINFGSMSGVPEEYDDYVSGNIGFDLSIGFNQYFKNSDVYWGMDLGLASRGCSVKDFSYKESYNSYCIKFVPFTVGYKYKVNDNIKIDPHLGIFFSIDFAESYPNEYENNYYEEESPIQPFDIGMQFGVGAWFKKFNVDLSWQQGFLEYVNIDDDDNWKHGAFMLRLGLEF